MQDANKKKCSNVSHIGDSTSIVLSLSCFSIYGTKFELEISK